MDELGFLDHTDSAVDFGRMVYERLNLPADSEELCDCVVRTPPRSLTVFLKKLWPIFIEEIKKEVKGGQNISTSVGEGD